MAALSDLILRTLPMLWLGMAAAISLLETPLKFRAPGVTLEIGLGIGRIVFHALNAVELVLATLLTAAIIIGIRKDTQLTSPVVLAATAAAVVILLVQVFAVRPVLDERLDARVRGESLAPSHHHVAYIRLEAGKLLALGTLGVSIAVASRSST